MAPLKVGNVEIEWVATVPPENNKGMPPYVKQSRKTEVLPAGWKKTETSRPLPVAVIYDQDIEFAHSDGVKVRELYLPTGSKLADVKEIHLDIIRPVAEERVPALLAVSPYGKHGHGMMVYLHVPYHLGIKDGQLSGLEKFESPDPAEWAKRGYAMVNVDVRGSWESEGNLYAEGTQPGKDAAEVCEFIAAQPWCNGAVGMAGNSWLATTQWTTAIARPPSLRCIAPWEGFNDFYRNVLCRGGIPKTDFASFIFDGTIRGRNKREDLRKMLEKYPLMNDYWADKTLDCSEIDIPIYAVASYSSTIHTFGTIEAFNQARSKQKWLRFHSTQEWYDLYSKEATDDLQRFFDRYLKMTDNGWDKTVPVRVSVLSFGDRFGLQPIDNIPFTEYPPKQTEYKKLYLASHGTLVPGPVGKESTVVYEPEKAAAKSAEFKHIFSKRITLIGYPKVKIWLSIEGSDTDIYISLRKISKTGKELEQPVIPWSAIPEGVNTQEDIPNAGAIKHTGPTGLLRLSHRAQDPERSTDIIPYHPHTKEKKVRPGEVVPVEIGIWPMGIIFEEGEGLLLRIQGELDSLVVLPGWVKKGEEASAGKHTIHVGGQYDSSLTIPVVPV